MEDVNCLCASVVISFRPLWTYKSDLKLTKKGIFIDHF